jgi:hypothetical protein
MKSAPRHSASTAQGTHPTYSRRRILAISIRLAGFSFLLAPLSGTLVACEDTEPSCVDPELLSTPERGLRASQNYVDLSAHGVEKQCGGCQFFKAVDDTACGRCDILGGPVDRSGHCNAWSKARLG